MMHMGWRLITRVMIQIPSTDHEVVHSDNLALGARRQWHGHVLIGRRSRHTGPVGGADSRRDPIRSARRNSGRSTGRSRHAPWSASRGDRSSCPVVSRPTTDHVDVRRPCRRAARRGGRAGVAAVHVSVAGAW
ncbi:hypothetical protein H4W31_003928 [Plantactinospora soyae]|uniref:Uncharacterized protein n=1 Tax=Plantactinospora soyae TaxID=1544732 RepID=A0A927MC01_9ACTN|nr:hypothetical protein [Plantactinospora soyae]